MKRSISFLKDLFPFLPNLQGGKHSVVTTTAASLRLYWATLQARVVNP
jgi:hypothetical protein